MHWMTAGSLVGLFGTKVMSHLHAKTLQELSLKFF